MRAVLKGEETEQYMRKLEETLSMTRRWATDSRHITQRLGMYWSYSLMQETCTSTRETTRMPRKMRRMLQRICMSTIEIRVTWRNDQLMDISPYPPPLQLVKVLGNRLCEVAAI